VHHLTASSPSSAKAPHCGDIAPLQGGHTAGCIRAGVSRERSIGSSTSTGNCPVRSLKRTERGNPGPDIGHIETQPTSRNPNPFRCGELATNRIDWRRIRHPAFSGTRRASGFGACGAPPRLGGRSCDPRLHRPLREFLGFPCARRCSLIWFSDNARRWSASGAGAGRAAGRLWRRRNHPKQIREIVHVRLVISVVVPRKGRAPRTMSPRAEQNVFAARLVWVTPRWRRQSRANPSLKPKSLLAGKIQGILFV
jgi:hypothetical protein